MPHEIRLAETLTGDLVEIPPALSLPSIFLPLFLVCSCVSSDNISAHSFRIYEENGLEIAETTGGPRYEQELFHYEEILVLEDDPERPESLLFSPRDFSIDNAGNIYVIDSGDYRVAVFNPDGEFIRSFGSEGDGPGEFRAIRLQYHRDRTLSIFDQTLQRATYYTTDGQLLQVVGTHAGLHYAHGIYRTESGQMLYAYQSEKREGKYGYKSKGMLIVDSRGDTLADIKTAHMKAGYYWSVPSGAGGSSIPFAPQPVCVFDPGGRVILSSGEEPELEIYDLTGTLACRIITGLEREAIPAEERREILNYLDNAVNLLRERNDQSNLAFFKGMRDEIEFHEWRAFWKDCWVDDGGFYWLEWMESNQAVRRLGGLSFRIFSPKGEYLGNTRWPADWGNVSNGYFITAIRDEETGHRRPTVFRIIPTVEGLDYP